MNYRNWVEAFVVVGCMSVGMSGCSSDKVDAAGKAVDVAKRDIEQHTDKVTGGADKFRSAAQNLAQQNTGLAEAQVNFTVAFDAYAARVRDELANLKQRIAVLPARVDATTRAALLVSYDQTAAHIATLPGVTVPHWETFKLDTGQRLAALDASLAAVEK